MAKKDRSVGLPPREERSRHSYPRPRARERRDKPEVADCRGVGEETAFGSGRIEDFVFSSRRNGRGVIVLAVLVGLVVLLGLRVAAAAAGW